MLGLLCIWILKLQIDYRFMEEEYGLLDSTESEIVPWSVRWIEKVDPDIWSNS